MRTQGGYRPFAVILILSLVSASLLWAEGSSDRSGAIPDWTDCPAETARGPVTQKRSYWMASRFIKGEKLVERKLVDAPKHAPKRTLKQGNRVMGTELVKPLGPFPERSPVLLHDSDSYPRYPAEPVSGPTLTKAGDGYLVEIPAFTACGKSSQASTIV